MVLDGGVTRINSLRGAKGLVLGLSSGCVIGPGDLHSIKNPNRDTIL